MKPELRLGRLVTQLSEVGIDAETAAYAASLTRQGVRLPAHPWGRAPRSVLAGMDVYAFGLTVAWRHPDWWTMAQGRRLRGRAPLSTGLYPRSRVDGVLAAACVTCGDHAEVIGMNVPLMACAHHTPLVFSSDEATFLQRADHVGVSTLQPPR